MKNVESAEIKVGQDAITFEVGQMVSVGNCRESISKIWINDKEEVRLEVSGVMSRVLAPHAVRFLNNTVDCRLSNVLLDILEQETEIKSNKAFIKKFKILRRTMLRRKATLERHGLIASAVEAQIRSEFKELYE